MRFEEWEVWYAVRYDLDLTGCHVMNGEEKFAALFCHDYDFRRTIDDLTHHIALGARPFDQYRVKRRDNRHFKARQEFENVATGLTAENPIFVLERNNIESCAIEELGCLDIVSDPVVVNLEAHRRGIVIGAVRIGHGDDAGLKVRPTGRDCPVKIMRKRSNSTTARKIVPDESHTLKEFHLIVSCGRLTSIEPGWIESS